MILRCLSHFSPRESVNWMRMTGGNWNEFSSLRRTVYLKLTLTADNLHMLKW
jgi:hypothetical protein